MTQSTIHIYVSYPRTPSINFKTAYYLSSHMPRVAEHFTPHGLQSWSVVQFDDASDFHTQTIMVFGSEEEFKKGQETMPKELFEDIANFSNVMPVQWVGKVVGRG